MRAVPCGYITPVTRLSRFVSLSVKRMRFLEVLISFTGKIGQYGRFMHAWGAQLAVQSYM